MNLQELIEKGALVKEGTQRKTVTWNNGTEDVVFDVLVKREWTVADYESVSGYLNSADREDISILAMRVHRMTRQADGNKFPLETCLRFKVSFLQAICTAINEVEVDIKEPVAKKRSAPRKKSSAN